MALDPWAFTEIGKHCQTAPTLLLIISCQVSLRGREGVSKELPRCAPSARRMHHRRLTLLSYAPEIQNPSRPHSVAQRRLSIASATFSHAGSQSLWRDVGLSIGFKVRALSFKRCSLQEYITSVGMGVEGNTERATIRRTCTCGRALSCLLTHAHGHARASTRANAHVGDGVAVRGQPDGS